MREIPEVVYTHAGRFHADDVFGAALLKILKPEVAIRRVFQLPEDFEEAYEEDTEDGGEDEE